MVLIIPLENQEGNDPKALPKLLLNVPEQPKNSDLEISTDNTKDESGSSTGSYEAQAKLEPVTIQSSPLPMGTRG